MSRRRAPDALERAGSLLMAAGFIAAVVAGVHGLADDAAGTVIFAVVTLIGYGIAGWMLVALGERSLPVAAPVAVLASLLAFALLGGPVAGSAQDPSLNLVFFPLLVLLLAYAAGAIIAHALARSVERTTYAVRGADQAGFLLHAAAAPTVWALFIMVEAVGPGVAGGALSLAVAGTGLVAIAASTGGHLVESAGHPRYVLAAGAAALAANAYFLVEFTRIGTELGVGTTGARFVALVGMLLAAFPVTFAAVAYYEAELERGADVERTRPIA